MSLPTLQPLPPLGTTLSLSLSVDPEPPLSSPFLPTLLPLSFERDRPSFYGFLFLSAPPPPLDEDAGRNETIGKTNEIYVSTALKIVN